jgi:hypothetical protein
MVCAVHCGIAEACCWRVPHDVRCAANGRWPADAILNKAAHCLPDAPARSMSSKDSHILVFAPEISAFGFSYRQVRMPMMGLALRQQKLLCLSSCCS